MSSPAPTPRVTPPPRITRNNANEVIPNFFALAFTVADTRKVLERIARMPSRLQEEYLNAITPDTSLQNVIAAATLNVLSRDVLRLSTHLPALRLRSSDSHMSHAFLALARYVHTSLQNIDPTVYQLVLYTDARVQPPSLRTNGGFPLIAAGQRYTAYFSDVPTSRSPAPPYEPQSPSPQDVAQSPTPPRAQAPSPESQTLVGPGVHPPPVFLMPPAAPTVPRDEVPTRVLSRIERIDGLDVRVFTGTHEEYLRDQTWLHGTHANGDPRLIDRHVPVYDVDEE